MHSASNQTVQFAKAYRAEKPRTARVRTHRARGVVWARWRGGSP